MGFPLYLGYRRKLFEAQDVPVPTAATEVIRIPIPNLASPS
jgi:hypothetical protein